MKHTTRPCFLILTFILCGCSSHPLQLTQHNTQKTGDYEKLPRIRASSTGFALLGIIPINFSSREIRARNSLLIRSGGDDIIEPAVSSKYLWTPIGSFVRFTLEATPIKKNALFLNNANEGDLIKKLQELQKMNKSGSLTDEEYVKAKKALLSN